MQILRSLFILTVLVFAVAGCSSGGAESNEGADMTGATDKPTPLPSSVPQDASQRGQRGGGAPPAQGSR